MCWTTGWEKRTFHIWSWKTNKDQKVSCHKFSTYHYSFSPAHAKLTPLASGTSVTIQAIRFHYSSFRTLCNHLFLTKNSLFFLTSRIICLIPTKDHYHVLTSNLNSALYYSPNIHFFEQPTRTNISSESSWELQSYSFTTYV